MPHFKPKTALNLALVHIVQQFVDVTVIPSSKKYYYESISPCLRLAIFWPLFMPSQFS
ncbi:hypothetical protein C7476_109176 [Phyllobacterium bourgognense]|uniref:Uncharacterized protein n=1 Tax=Phyllobacterium bourgognense TaxID=314236 RepID=A0A368YUY5_9HYPH|nr:hypothetical protein C7476_109176 [Phyllobacterium bourgognense]